MKNWFVRGQSGIMKLKDLRKKTTENQKLEKLKIKLLLLLLLLLLLFFFFFFFFLL